MVQLRRCLRALNEGAHGWQEKLPLVLAYSGCLWALFVAVSVLDAVVMRPLPVHKEAELAVIRELVESEGRPARWSWTTGARFSTVAQQLDAAGLEVAGVSGAGSKRISAGEWRLDIFTVRATPRIFRVLRPASFLCGDGALQANADGKREVVVSAKLASTLNSDPKTFCGSSIALDDGPAVVRGVLVPTFPWPGGVPDLWLPGTPAELESSLSVEFVVRSASTDWKSVTPLINSSWASAVAAYPAKAGLQLKAVLVEPFRTAVEGERSAPGTAIAIAVLLVVSIAAVNVVFVLWWRAHNRVSDYRIRLSLGATYTDLLSKNIGEQGTCLGAAFAFGAAMAAITIPALNEIVPQEMLWNGAPSMPRLMPAGLLALATCLSIALTSVLSATIGWRVAAATMNSVSEGRRHSAHRTRVRYIVVAAQLSIVTTILSGAAIVSTRALEMSHRQLGFSVQDLWSFRVRPPRIQDWRPQDSVEYFSVLLNSVKNTSGVNGVALASAHPLGGIESKVTVRADCSNGTEISSIERGVSSNYFEVMSMDVQTGRTFSTSLKATPDQLEVVVNKSLSSALCGIDLVGRSIRIAMGSREVSGIVVGIVQDTVRRELEASLPEVYVPLLNGPTTSAALLVRSHDQQIGETIGRLILAQHPTQALSLGDPENVSDLVRRVLSIPVAQSIALLVMSMLAITLAVAGVISLTAAIVSARRKEFAIRQALGAHPATLLSRVVSVMILCASLGVLMSLGMFRNLAAKVGIVASGDLESSLIAPLVSGSVVFLVGIAATIAAGRSIGRASVSESLRQD